MYQQINMYQPVFRLQQKIFSTATLLKIIAVVMILMVALYSNAHSTMRGLQRISADLAQNYTQLDAQLGTFTAIQALPTNLSTDDDITTLQDQIDDHNALLARVDSLFLDTVVGFGDVFEILAQTQLPGLWLTGVQLNQDGNIEISGTALDPILVPRYLQLITKQSLLTPLNSGTVSLTRIESKQSEINFLLSYTPPGEER